ncbi:MAG TPA: hypothetical protein VL326_25405 [Kofleriaceae bacterium]|nr:hypothetical protein [Kofleriaceae bacterium]
MHERGTACTTLVGYCTTPFGTTSTNYQSCSPVGNDTSCQTGMCAHDDDGHQQCLVPCTGSDSTCPNSNSCHTITDPATIEGVPFGSQRGCFS